MHGVEEKSRRKQLTCDLFDIARHLRSNFDADQWNAQARKDATKRQVMDEILTTARPHKRSDCCETDDDIKVLTKNAPNINFLTKDPRMPDLKSRDRLLITSCISQIQNNRVYIDNDSGTDILYEHCFQQLPTSWKEGLAPPTVGLLVGFTGHNLWPLGTIHIPLTITSHDGRDRITHTIHFPVVRFSSGNDVLLGRPTLFQLQAIPSTIHDTMKFSASSGLETIVGTSSRIR